MAAFSQNLAPAPDPSAGAGALPPELAGMMGGGEMPPELMDPAMMGGMDPSMGMGAPTEADPMAMGMTPPSNPYPTTDPNFMSQVFEQLMQMRQADHSKLDEDQAAAIQASPLAQGLLSGAPMGPGAGQDGQAIGVDPSAMPPMGL